MNTKEYSEETLALIEKIKNRIASLKAALKTKLDPQTKRKKEQELKTEEDNLVYLKKQKIKNKDKVACGFAS